MSKPESKQTDADEAQINRLTAALNETLTQINSLTNTVADIQNQIELIKNKK